MDARTSIVRTPNVHQSDVLATTIRTSAVHQVDVQRPRHARLASISRPSGVHVTSIKKGFYIHHCTRRAG
jgi:hypothetical protein